MNDIKKTIDGLKRMRIGLFNGKIDGEPMKPYLDAAIEALEKQLNDEVKDLVEVIRCKDCSYSEKKNHSRERNYRTTICNSMEM